MRVLEDPPAAGGAYAPAESFDAGSFLAALESRLEIVRDDQMSAHQRRSHR